MYELTFPTANVTPGSGLTINSLPNAGRGTMANSLGVAIASNQSVTSAVSFNSGAVTNAVSTFTRSANVTMSTVNVSTSASPYFTWTSANPPINGQGFSLLGSAVPGGFSAGTVYWAVGVSGSTFNLSATLGGAAIVPSSTGTAVTATLSYKPNDLIADSTTTPGAHSFSIATSAGGVIIPRIRLRTNAATGTLGAPITFVTSQTFGSPIRNDFGNSQGFQFTVGNSPITVTDLGRWVLSGNNQAHTLTIFAVNGHAVMATVSLPTSGAAVGAYAYATLPSPATLSANTSYYLITTEVANLDTWYNNVGGSQTTTNAASFDGPVWTPDNGATYNLQTGGSYGPLNFKYRLGGAVAPSWDGSILSVNLWSAAPTYIGGDARLYAPASGVGNWLANFLVLMVQFGDGATGGGTLIGAGQTSLKLASGTAVYWDVRGLSYVQPNASQTFTLTAECVN